MRWHCICSADLQQALENQCARVKWHKVTVSNMRAAVHLPGTRSQVTNVTIYFERGEKKNCKTLFYTFKNNRTRLSNISVQPCQRSRHISKIACSLPNVFEIAAKNKRIGNNSKATKLGAKKLNEINNILSQFSSKESTITLPETSEELKNIRR